MHIFTAHGGSITIINNSHGISWFLAIPHLSFIGRQPAPPPFPLQCRGVAPRWNRRSIARHRTFEGAWSDPQWPCWRAVPNHGVQRCLSHGSALRNCWFFAFWDAPEITRGTTHAQLAVACFFCGSVVTYLTLLIVYYTIYLVYIATLLVSPRRSAWLHHIAGYVRRFLP